MPGWRLCCGCAAGAAGGAAQAAPDHMLLDPQWAARAGALLQEAKAAGIPLGDGMWSALMLCQVHPPPPLPLSLPGLLRQMPWLRWMHHQTEEWNHACAHRQFAVRATRDLLHYRISPSRGQQVHKMQLAGWPLVPHWLKCPHRSSRSRHLSALPPRVAAGGRGGERRGAAGAQVRAGLADECARTLAGAHAAGVPPSVRSFNVLLGGYKRARQVGLTPATACSACLRCRPCIGEYISRKCAKLFNISRNPQNAYTIAMVSELRECKACPD